MSKRVWLKFEFFGVAILAFYIAIAVVPGVFTTQDPLDQEISVRLATPGSEHIFGTDELGRDLFARCVYGAKSTLLVAFMAVVISTTIGVVLGLISGYSEGVVDNFLSRANEILISFPAIIIALGLVSVVGQNILAIALVIGFVNTPSFFRVTRAITLQVKNLAYVDAVKTFGASTPYLLVKTILPNSYNEILVQVLLIASRAIIVEASLSFLGLGVPPPAPSWGGMLSVGRNFMYQNPWYSIFPGLFIVLLVLAIQLTARFVKRGGRK